MMTINHGLVECGVMSTGLSTTLADWSRRRYVSLLKSTHSEVERGHRGQGMYRLVERST